MLQPKLSDFLLDLRRSLAHQGLAKSLDIFIGMPTIFANPAASRSRYISSQKIAQLRYNYFNMLTKLRKGFKRSIATGCNNSQLTDLELN